MIAVLATFWVLFVFSFSGWLIHILDTSHYARPLAARNAAYESMLVDAVRNPTDNIRNIYFGLIMGVSAMLPTCAHMGMFVKAFLQTAKR